MTTRDFVDSKSGEFWKRINSSEKIVTHLHERPDPDSVGSALSLKLVLEKMGKKVDVITQRGDLLPSVDFLPGYGNILEIDYKTFDFSQYDLFVMLDVSTASRISKNLNYENPFVIPTILIDHHEGNDINADLKIVDVNAPAVCEMLYWLYQAGGVAVEEDVAACLFTGIWTDTVGMKIAEVTADTFQAVAEMVKAGAKPNEIIFNVVSLTNEQLKQVGKVLSTAKELAGGEIVIFYQRLADMNNVDYYDYTYASEVVKLRMSENSDAAIAVLLYESEGVANVSFRANNYRKPVDVAAIAQTLGGGGHKAAAGAKLPGKTLEEAEELVLVELKNYTPIFNPKFRPLIFRDIFHDLLRRSNQQVGMSRLFLKS